MKPKDDLFLLIKSLSKTEKGYFNKFAQMHGGTKEGNYLKLFHIIDGMESYDESVLKETIKGTGMAKHLSVSKNYLFKFILRSLSSFHRDNIPELQIYHQLAEERVLRARRLPVNQEHQLRKAEGIALQYGESQFLPLIQWIQFDRNLRKNFDDYNDEEYEAWRKDFLTLGEHQLEEIQMAVYMMDLLRSRSNYAQYTKQLEETVQQPLMQTVPAHLSVKSQLSYWGIWDRYFQMKGDMTNYIRVTKASVQLIMEQPQEYREKNAHLIINKLGSLCAAWLKQENEAEVKNTLDALRAVDVSNHLGLERLQRRYLLEIELSSIKLFGKLGELKVFEGKVKTAIEEAYATEIPLNQGAIRFMLGVGLMIDNEPQAAIDYFNWLLQDKTYAPFAYYPYCWYWTVLAHYQMGNYALIPSFVSSINNILKKRLASMPTEKSFVKDLKKLATIKNATEAQAIFEGMRTDINEGIKTANPVDKKGYSELLEWLDRKLIS